MLLLEDDALPHKDILPVLNRILAPHRTENVRNHRRNVEHFDYMKLYHPDKTLGYLGGDLYAFIDLFLTSVTLGTILFYVHYILQSRLHLPRRNCRALLLWLHFVAYMSAICVCIGRVTLLEGE